MTTLNPMRTPTASTSKVQHVTRLSALTLAALLASGCSMLQEDKIDYKSAKQTNSLEIPPDLTQLSRTSQFTVPGGVVTASGFESAQPNRAAVVAANQIADVRMERLGGQRWLVVDRPPEQLWPALKDFWQENGFNLTVEQQNIGILETDWAENRAKLPQDFIRATIGRVFENLYSTGERDRFRTRVERNAQGGTEIYVSHRGMIEVYTSDRKEQTVWQPRPADTELEIEFMRRMMVKLGVSQEQTQAVVAGGIKASAARVAAVNNVPVLQLDETFDLAWRRVGVALDRTGFTVEDRNRADGVYFVRYVPPSEADAQAKPGFFSRVFTRTKTPDVAPARYRIIIKTAGNTSTVSVLNDKGQPEASTTAQRIVQILADDLK